MKDWFKLNGVLLVSFILNILLAVLLCISCKQEKPTGVVVTKYVQKTDTIVATKETIKKKTKTIYVNTTDTFYTQVTDTAIDSIFVTVPIEYKEYKDTIKTDSTESKLHIYYHGSFADLDSISLQHSYNKETTIITKEPKKVGFVWAVGPSVGFGGVGNLNNGSIGYGPYIGVSGTIGIGGFIK